MKDMFVLHSRLKAKINLNLLTSSQYVPQLNKNTLTSIHYLFSKILLNV